MASEVKTNKVSPSTGSATEVTGLNVGSDAAGDVLYHDGTNYTRLAKPGTPADEVLTFATGASAPSWVASAAGGMVLQVKVTSSNSTISTSSTSYVTTGLSITTDAPASTSSRFILTLAGGTTYSNYAAGEVWTTFYVGGSEVSDTGPYSMIQENDRYHITMIPNNFFTNSAMMVHSPASVSAQTYAVFFKANANGAFFNLASSRVVFTVMELSS
jgi:hypothetical protein